MELQSGSLILNRFRVIEKIGSGGMGAIYKVFDTTLERNIVLKILSTSFNREKSMIRFQNEARALSRLSHSNIAKVYDFGVLADGQPYLAIEYVDGVTLDRFLNEGLALKLSQLLEIFVEICDALDQAHREDVVHRDLKPSNIMLVFKGDKYSPVILDFGIAKIILENDEPGAQQLTKTGEIIGSPLYMSPEQASGLPVTTRSDQYSLGCVLFYSLTGRPPFNGETLLETIRQHKETTPPTLTAATQTEWSDDLESIVGQMLAKKPDHRFENISVLRDRLIQALEFELEKEELAESAESSSEVVSPPMPSRLSKAWFIVPLVFVILIGLCLTYSTTHNNPPPPPPVEQDFRLGQDLDPEIQAYITKQKKLKKHSFHFPQYSVTTNHHLAGLKGYRFATEVNLDDTSVDDEGLKYLVGLPVKSLHLKGLNVKTLEYVCQIKTLEELYLQRTQIDDDAVKNLTKLKMLHQLRLDETELTDKCIPYIKAMPTLKLVVFDDSNVSPQGLEELQTSMPDCAFSESMISKTTKLREQMAKFNAEQKYEEAAEADRKVIAIIESAQGKDSPALLDYLLFLSQILILQKKFPEALGIADRVTDIATKYGEDRMHSNGCYHRAIILREQGKPAEALAPLKEAFKFYDAIEPPDSANRLSMMQLIADTEFMAGDQKQAMEDYRKCLKTANEVAGPNSIQQEKMTLGMAHHLIRIKETAEAEHYYKIVLASLEEQGVDRERAQMAVEANAGLANCAVAKKELKSAIEYRKKALKLCDEFGMDKRSKNMRSAIARLLRKDGREDEAKKYDPESNGGGK